MTGQESPQDAPQTSDLPSNGHSPRCVSCGRVKAIRRKGLCHGCYRKDDIRQATPNLPRSRPPLQQSCVLSGIPPGREACIHCGQRLACRRRLCHPCYNSKEVRAQHCLETYTDSRGVTRAYVKGYAPKNGERHPLPAEPTSFLPGTPEKAAVLEARADRGEILWHPLDAKGEPPDLPWVPVEEVEEEEID